MAAEAQYVAPLQVVERAENRARIIAIAEAEKISQAQVIRDLIAYGLSWREARSRERVAGLGGPSVQP